MKILSTLVAVFCLFSLTAKDFGMLKGSVSDVNSGIAIPYAQIMLSNEACDTLTTQSDYSGEYHFLKIDTGFWDIKVTARGFQSKEFNRVKIKADKLIILRISLTPGVSLDEVVITEYSKPLIEKDQTTVATTATREQIQRMAVRSVSDIAKTAGNGVYSRDNGSLNVRGSRGQNNVTFIDGIKVIGSTSLPSSAIEEVTVTTSGVSAQYENNVSEETSQFRITDSHISHNSHYTPPRRKSQKSELELLFEKSETEEIFDSELYQEIADNPFESPFNTPLSTFSIDVDKAAYANVRRFLNQGYLPPVNAVRIEEMINYFDYDYPQPKAEHPFSITTELAVSPWNSERLLAMIGLQGEKVDLSDAPPSNLVFLVDVSGSMSSANKLDLLKKGMKLLVDELRAEDRVAIVVYAGAAGLVMKSTSGKEKFKIKSTLSRLTSGGSTAGGAGIQLAYKIAKQNFIEGGNNRVILATDGDFNVGTSSQEGLVSMIEEKRSSGIFLSVLGFGMYNLQDYKMEQLANKGNGNYNYIDNLLEAKKVLVKEMGGTLLTIAKDVKIQAEFNPAKVKAYRLIGYVNRALAPEDFNNDLKDAGELGSGHAVTALYEIVPADSPERIQDVDSLKYQKNEKLKAPLSDEILTVKFRYKKPDGDTSTLMTRVLKDERVELADASVNLRFSAAVASFGMKLRSSPSVAQLEFDEITELAKGAMGKDREGYRAEFLKLVEMAQLIKQSD